MDDLRPEWAALQIPGLKGKRILVTGASSGIGRGLALAFAAQGCDVVVHCNRQIAAAREVAGSAMAMGVRAFVVQADLTKSAECRRMVEEAGRSLGGLDGLVNNVGGLGVRIAAEDVDDAAYERVMDMNARSTLSVSAASIGWLRQQGGFIINVSSIAARRGGGPGTLLYTASKGFVSSLTRGLAKELGPRIRVNAISPGVVDTPFHDVAIETLSAFAADIPMRRIAQIDDVIGTALYLGSDLLSGYVTGQIIEVNGGALMP